MTTLDGQVALVTGASRGVGRGVALGLAHAVRERIRNRSKRDKHGTRVRISRPSRATIPTTGLSQTYFAGNRRQNRQTGHSRQCRVGRLRANGCRCASSRLFAPFWKQPLWRWDAMVTAGVRAAFVASQHAARTMVEAHRGLIVHISSWAAQKHIASTLYGVAKRRQISWHRTWHTRLNPTG
jgi:NAD(P)-dependent dehydrogenase (short-subunit alcohol dehydrogenase family)